MVHAFASWQQGPFRSRKEEKEIFQATILQEGGGEAEENEMQSRGLVGPSLHWEKNLRNNLPCPKTFAHI